MNKIKRIVYCFPFNIDTGTLARDSARFGFETMSQQFKVDIILMGNLVYGEKMSVDSLPSFRTLNFILINSEKELDRLFKTFDEEMLIINFCSYCMETLGFYRKLNRSAVPYAVFIALPVLVAPPEIRQGKNLKRLLRPDLYLRYTKILLSQIILNFFRKKLRPADYALVSGSECISYYSSSFLLGDETLPVKAHQLDYDLWLKEQISESSAPVEGEYAVFIDQYLPYHPDNEMVDCGQVLDPERYYSELNDFFRRFTDYTGKKIVIALHPRADYSDKKYRFESEYQFKGETVSLIKNCRLVMMHSSTAINYAVLERKPMMFIMNREIIDSNDRITMNQIEAVSCYFNNPVVQTDKIKMDKWKEYCRIDSELYRKYQTEYIKQSDSPELPFWDIVSKKLVSDK